MPRLWTHKQRAAQAERCRQQQPWKHSTGPRTAAGKRRSSQNARKPASWAAHDALIEAAYECIYQHDDIRTYRQLIRAARLMRRRLARR